MWVTHRTGAAAPVPFARHTRPSHSRPTWCGSSMIFQEVLEAVQVHARGSSDATGPGLADVLWRYHQGSEALDLDAVWVDLVRLFQAMHPERLVWQEHGAPVALGHAIGEMLIGATQLSLSAPEEEARRQGALICFRVALSWEALMAGDFDDIAEHVRLEEWALQLSPTGE